MQKNLLVFGTKLEEIKMCSLVNELKIERGVQTDACVTRKHEQMRSSGRLVIFGDGLDAKRIAGSSVYRRNKVMQVRKWSGN